MRWSGQELSAEDQAALPGLVKVQNLVRSVTTPDFAGIRFHEVLAKSALNRVPGQSQMPFGWTINPYRGCSHACTFCVQGSTLVKMADGRQKAIMDLRVGDLVIGTESHGRYRRYVVTPVLAHWSTVKPAHVVRLRDGTEITASGEHRFLTERGWKHVTSGSGVRPHLTTNNKLLGFGLAGLSDLDRAPMLDPDYRHGYLTGMIRGDAHLGEHHYVRPRGTDGSVYQFRLALADVEGLVRTKTYLDLEDIHTSVFSFYPGNERHRPIEAIRTAKRADVERIRELIAWQSAASLAWHRGFLAGVFDAEGSNSGVIRISNKDPELLAQIRDSMDELGIDHVDDVPSANGCSSVRVVGGLPARERFFQLTAPAITRRLSIEGMAVKSEAKLQVESVTALGVDLPMFDITTGTGDFLANGVISHNCFARNTHTYLDLDAGHDFDAEIIVKVNVGEVLAKELAKPSWRREPVALGTNTDPYQRAEGRYKLMPGIIAALADSGTPFSILTKGNLLRRDLPLLVEASSIVPVDLAMTIAVHDDELQQSVEPGAPTTASRLETVRAVRAAGLDIAVFMMPVLPYLTDTREHLERAISAISAAGADRVLYTALHLRPGAKEWFFLWLEREHPELVPRYRAMYAGGASAPKDYRRWLGAKVRPLLRRYGLSEGGDTILGSIRDTALAAARAGAETTLIQAALPPSTQPTLF